MTHSHIYSFVRYAIFLFIIVAAYSYTPFTNAYFTTSQRAINLGDGSALFLIDFAFGMKNHEVQIPVFAYGDANVKNSSLSYTILDEDDEVAIGTMSAIVLSSAVINSEKMYAVPKNQLGKFILMVVFTPTVTSKINEYRLQVTDLPFNFDGIQQLRLNPSELKYYTTKLLSI